MLIKRGGGGQTVSPSCRRLLMIKSRLMLNKQAARQRLTSCFVVGREVFGLQIKITHAKEREREQVMNALVTLIISSI